jgi:hypothetical protein
MPHTMGAVCGDGVDANGKVVVVAPFLYGAKFCESTINDNMNSVRLKTYFEVRQSCTTDSVSTRRAHALLIGGTTDMV